MSRSTSSVRVLIAEDKLLYAQALAQVLAADPEIEIVGIAGGAEIPTPLRDVDVLIVDRDKSQTNDAVEHFKSRFPHAKVCDLSKDSSLQQLLTAVKRLKNDHAVPANELSPREREIIRLIAQGFSNRDIGQRLVLSEKTIKNHVSHIFTKIRCTARSQAAVHAIRTGLV